MCFLNIFIDSKEFFIFMNYIKTDFVDPNDGDYSLAKRTVVNRNSSKVTPQKS